MISPDEECGQDPKQGALGGDHDTSTKRRRKTNDAQAAAETPTTFGVVDSTDCHRLGGKLY
jgi:hypothetical protein